MWVDVSLKVPDEHDWVALMNVTPEGDATIIGYIFRSKFEAMVAGCEEMGDSYRDWLNQ